MRVSDVDLCAFCPRLCRHACPVAVGSAREAAVPAVIMGEVYAWVSGTGTAEAAARSAALCTGCGACTRACAIARPVSDLLAQVRAALTPPAAVEAPGPLEGDGEWVAIETDSRPWAAALAAQLGAPVARLRTRDELGRALLDHPEPFAAHARHLREVIGLRTLVAPSRGVERVAAEAGLACRPLHAFAPADPSLPALPPCGQADNSELLACCGASPPLSLHHPETAEAMGAEAARRLGGRPHSATDAVCAEALRRHGATIDDPVARLLRAGRPSPAPAG
jgi:ferredoxin